MTKYDTQKLNGDATADLKIVPKDEENEAVGIGCISCTIRSSLLYQIKF